MGLHSGICEDDLIHIKILKNHIKEVIKSKNLPFEIYEFKSGEELIKNYPKYLDILFLDIQMEGLTGMDTARRIREFDNNVEILFTTSLNECILNILEKSKNFLIINNKNKLIKIMLEDVLYMETEGRELVIHKINDAYKVKMSMRKLEKLLQGKKFFRCHNSFMVNLDKIECIDKNIVYINKAQIPVSKHRIQSLKKELTNILGAIIC